MYLAVAPGGSSNVRNRTCCREFRRTAKTMLCYDVPAFDTDCRTLSTIPGPLRNRAIDAGDGDGSWPVGRQRVRSPHRG
jgi:hypothetical protein